MGHLGKHRGKPLRFHDFGASRRPGHGHPVEQLGANSYETGRGFPEFRDGGGYSLSNPSAHHLTLSRSGVRSAGT